MKRTMPILLAALLLAAALLPGCSLFESKPDPAAGEAGRQGALGRYYDFDDIQVPLALKLDKKKSMLFRAGSLKCGVLVFAENVEVESLVNFFIDSMNRDNWQLKSSSKYPKVMMFFAKPGKTAIVQIVEHTFSTEVEIWVAPAA